MEWTAYTPDGTLQTWSQPDSSSAPGWVAPRGLRVEILEQRPDGWVQVRFDNGFVCWVDGQRLLLQPPRGRWRWAAVLAAATVVGIGAGVGSFVLFGPGDSTPLESEMAAEQASASPTPAATPTQSGDTTPRFAPSPTATPPAAVSSPTAETEPTVEDDELWATLEALRAELESTPVEDRPPTVDARAGEAIRAEMEAAGIDTTGMGVSVWSFTADGTLLLIEVDDASAIAADGGDASATVGEDVLVQLLRTSPVEEAGVVRLAMRYRGSDEAGPYELVVTLDTVAALAAEAAGQELPPDATTIQFERAAS